MALCVELADSWQVLWKATFEGEGGMDAGGLFRDSVRGSLGVEWASAEGHEAFMRCRGVRQCLMRCPQQTSPSRSLFGGVGECMEVVSDARAV